MNFVLIAFIALGVLLLVLLFLIFRIFYKKSGRKLVMEYKDDNTFDKFKESFNHVKKINKLLNKRKDCFIV